MRGVVFGMLVAGLGLAGCDTLRQTPQVDLMDPALARPFPQARPVARSVNGSLFQAASYRPGFEDPRARVAGDTLTIQITENISATQKSSSSIDRSSKADTTASSIPFASKTLIDRLAIGANSSNTFAGKGGTESANTFSGSITVTVVDVLPNGHMVLIGEKQIGVNQNVDVLRFSGTVDPKFVQPGNVVLSSQVANARIESRSRGVQGEVQSIGWLQRFFLNVSPF